MQYHTTTGTGWLVDLVDRAVVLEALCDGPLDRETLERRLDVSTATGYRLTGWLDERGLLEATDGAFALTAFGEAIEDAVAAFDAEVRGAVDGPTTRDLLGDLLRYLPVLRALEGEPLPRRELEARLSISRSTSHRHTSALADLGLLERVAGDLAPTAAGRDVAGAGADFESSARIAAALAPVLDAIYGTSPDVDLSAFAGATVTSAEGGSAYSPMDRATSLFRESGSFRGLEPASIAPLYMEEFHGPILAGKETEIVQSPAVTAEIMANYPEACVEVCASEYFTPWLHDDLPFGLVVFDDRVGIGVRDPDGRTPRAFVDTDDPAVREWAESVYATYREEAVPLERFTEPGLAAAREALDGAA